MPLFGSRDFRGVARINQFLQVTPAAKLPGSELDRWLYRLMKEDGGTQVPGGYMGIAAYFDAEHPHTRDQDFRQLNRFVFLLPLLQRFAEGEAQRIVRREDAEVLGEFMASAPMWPETLAHRVVPASGAERDSYGRYSHLENTLAPEDITFPFSPQVFLWELEADLRKAVKDAVNHPEKFRICRVCERPFVATSRSDQYVCSDRCHRREAVRHLRRRQKREFGTVAA